MKMDSLFSFRNYLFDQYRQIYFRCTAGSVTSHLFPSRFKFHSPSPFHFNLQMEMSPIPLILCCLGLCYNSDSKIFRRCLWYEFHALGLQIYFVSNQFTLFCQFVFSLFQLLCTNLFIKSNKYGCPNLIL